MYVRLSLVLLATALFSTPLAAQTPAPPAASRLDATAGQLPKQVEDRLQFMRKMYALDAPQLAKARAEMMSLVGAHKSYMDGRSMILRRRAKAILLVLPSQPEMTDAERETIRKKLQGQIHRIHAEAPLSYANVAKLVEKSLGKDAIARGRKQMASSFAQQLAGAAVDIDKLDALVIPPLRPRPRVAAAPTPVARPAVAPPTRVRTAATPDHPPHPGHEAHAKLPPQPKVKLPPPPKGKLAPPRPPKVVAAAPPVDRWPVTLKATVTKYGFSENQSKSAESVLANCRKRAETHLAARKADYEKARKTTDAKVKAAQLKKLNARIDKLYHEMNQRIDSIASIEQRLANQADAKKAPAVKKPTEKPQAKKAEAKKTTAKADPGK